MKKFLFAVSFLLLFLSVPLHVSAEESLPMSVREGCTKVINSNVFPVVLFKTSSGSILNRSLVQDGECVSWAEKADLYFYVYGEGDMPPSLESIDIKDSSKAYLLESFDGDIASRFTYVAEDVDRMEDSLYIYYYTQWGSSIERTVHYSQGRVVDARCYFIGFFTNVSNKSVMPLPFIDLENHFSLPFVETLYNYGIIQGRTADTFVPEETMNRAEAVKIIAKTFTQLSESDIQKSYNEWLSQNYQYTYVVYKDVSVDAWYAPYVYILANQAHILDKQKEYFRPQDTISRAEFAKLAVFGMHLRTPDCYNFESAEKSKTWIMDTLNIKKEMSFFKDVSESSWMYVSTGFLRAFGYVDATEYFYPERSITRGEAAKIIAKILGPRTL